MLELPVDLDNLRRNASQMETYLCWEHFQYLLSHCVYSRSRSVDDIEDVKGVV